MIHFGTSHYAVYTEYSFSKNQHTVTKNIHVKILHHTNDVKLISISIFTKKSVQPQQLGNVKNQKFINNVIDMFFHLQIDKGSIEFLEKVQSFVIQVHSCPFCELFNLTKELSWSSNHINNNNGSSPTVNSAGDKIHYRAFEALYSCLLYTSDAADE